MISDEKMQQMTNALRELQAWAAKHRAVIHYHSEHGVIVSFIELGARARPYGCVMVMQREPCSYELQDVNNASKAWITLNTKISTISPRSQAEGKEVNDELRDSHRAYLGAEQTDPADDALYNEVSDGR